MTTLNIVRTAALPGTPAASTLYIIKGADATAAELYFTGTDGSEVRHVINKSEVQTLIDALASTVATKSGAETLTNKTLTTPLINGGTLTDVLINGFTEASYYPAAGSTFTVSLANGTLQKLRINANATITVPIPVAGKSYTIIIAYEGAYTVTFVGASGSTLKPVGGSMPTATSVSGKTDAYVFICDPDGTSTVIYDGWRNT